MFRPLPPLIAATLLSLSACSTLPPTSSPPAVVQDDARPPVEVPTGVQTAVVRKVVDGDTLRLRAVGAGPLDAGVDERVRLIGLDAPEVTGDDECFGAEAADLLADFTPVGASVRVVADRDTRDRYGRALLYVWNSDGVFVNDELVRRGAATPLLVKPNGRHIDRLRESEALARAANAGQWGACRP